MVLMVNNMTVVLTRACFTITATVLLETTRAVIYSITHISPWYTIESRALIICIIACVILSHYCTEPCLSVGWYHIYITYISFLINTMAHQKICKIHQVFHINLTLIYSIHCEWRKKCITKDHIRSLFSNLESS